MDVYTRIVGEWLLDSFSFRKLVVMIAFIVESSFYVQKKPVWKNSNYWLNLDVMYTTKAYVKWVTRKQCHSTPLTMISYFGQRKALVLI